MTPPPHTPDRGADDLSPSRRGRALVLFLGVWLIGTGFTLLFAHHKYNPFDAFTSRVPLIGIPAVIGAYAALLAGAWAAVPRFKSGFIDEAIHTGVTVVGGVFAPHALSSLFGSFP